MEGGRLEGLEQRTLEAICIKVILQKSQEKENREVWGLWREDIERRHKGWLKCSLKISTSLPHTIVEHLLDARHSAIDFERQKCIRCISSPRGKTGENRKTSLC